MKTRMGMMTKVSEKQSDISDSGLSGETESGQQTLRREFIYQVRRQRNLGRLIGTEITVRLPYRISRCAAKSSAAL